MIKRSKLIYAIGSVIIGIIAIVSVFVGLIFSGAIDARSVALVFTSQSQEKMYDGTALVCEEWSLVSGELKEGHTASVTVTGSQTGVGTTANALSARVFDANGADVTEDYEITCNAGSLTVTSRPITISSSTLEVEYNGAPVAVGEPEIMAGELVAGDIAQFQMIGEIVDVGVSENLFATTIINELGVDVTANYQITSFAGNVTVKGKPIEITSGGAYREYNGTPLTQAECKLTRGELLDGDTIEATYSGTITNVGSQCNSFQPKIINAEGEEVTGNYTITAIYGTLEVTPRPITITIEEVLSFPYNDQLYEISPDWNFSGTIGEDKVVECFFESVGRDAGRYPVEVRELKVYNKDGKDVSENYITKNFTAEGDVVEIVPRDIEIELIEEIENPDSTRLDNDYVYFSWELTNGELVGEDEIDYVACNLSREERENLDEQNRKDEIPYFTAIKKGVNISWPREFNYSVTCTEIFNDPFGSNGQDRELYNGIGGGALAAGNKDKDFVYLRWCSYGDYNVGNGWKDPISYDEPLYENFGMQYLTGLVLKEHRYESNELKIYLNPGAKEWEEIEDGKGNTRLLVPYYLDTDTTVDLLAYPWAVQSSDVFVSGYYNREIAYKYYDFDYTDLENLSSGLYYYDIDEYKQQAEAYEQFVYENYLDLPASTAQYMEDLLDTMSGKLIPTWDPVVMIPRVVEYIKSAAIYNENAKEIYGDADVIQSFFDKRVGNCKHYASAATALFRTFGIPARYTIGYRIDKELLEKYENRVRGESIKQGEGDKNFKLPDYLEEHAWVEVFVDGIGWVMADVTAPPPEPASIQLNIRSHQMYIDTFMNEYGGYFEITEEDVYSDDLTNLKNLGLVDRWDMEFTGGVMTGAGKSTVNIDESSIRFYLNDEDVTDNIKEQYILKCKPGTIHIYERELSVETASNGDGFVYNGSAQKHTEIASTDYTQLRENDRVFVNWTGSQKDVGSSSNTCTLTILDAEGKDVTELYKINYTYGKIKINPLSVIITAESAEKSYDGSALTCNEYKIDYVNGSIVPTDEFIVCIKGSQTEVGRSDNTIISVTVKDTNTTDDVTVNYNILEEVAGELRVTKN